MNSFMRTMEFQGVVKRWSWPPPKLAGLMKWKKVWCNADKTYLSICSCTCNYTESIYKEKLLLPTAPRAARGSDVNEDKIPNAPPYTAYIANLPYDIEVEDVNKFFHGLSVSLCSLFFNTSQFIL